MSTTADDAIQAELHKIIDADPTWLEKKWQSRKWRGFVGVELAMLIVAAALFTYADDDPAKLAIVTIWLDYAFKVFCAYIVGNVGAIVASGLTITAKEKGNGTA